MIRRADRGDRKFLESVWNHPEIGPYIRDDEAQNKTDTPWDQLLLLPHIYFLIPVLDGRQAGVFFIHPWNSICAEAHTLILPGFRQETALVCCREAIEWFFTYTSFRKVMTQVPVWNRAAYKLAVRVGFRTEGLNTKSFLWRGKLYDQVILGLRR